MTRLTDEQIDNVVHDVRQALGGKAWYRHFADRIAALAVQEVERERELAVNAHNHAHRRCAELELAHDRLRAEVASLTSQLAEVTKERDIARGRTEIRIEECVEYQNEIVRLRAQLAEVTKERDSARAERADLTSRNTALRAQLATAKREERIEGFKDGWHDAIERAMDMGLVDLGSFPITGRRKRERTKGEEWAIAGLGANEAASKRYPAIDPVTGTTCKQNCCRPSVCKPGEGCHAECATPATPSGAAKCAVCGRNCSPPCADFEVPATPFPEAREVPEVSLPCKFTWVGTTAEIEVRITPADAKRIVAMARIGGTE